MNKFQTEILDLIEAAVITGDDTAEFQLEIFTRLNSCRAFETAADCKAVADALNNPHRNLSNAKIEVDL
jgi:hypothetical protein